MAKSTISMAIFNSFLYVYQRVTSSNWRRDIHWIRLRFAAENRWYAAYRFFTSRSPCWPVRCRFESWGTGFWPKIFALVITQNEKKIILITIIYIIWIWKLYIHIYIYMIIIDIHIYIYNIYDQLRTSFFLEYPIWFSNGHASWSIEAWPCSTYDYRLGTVVISNKTLKVWVYIRNIDI